MKCIDKIGMIAMSGMMLGMVSCSDFSDYNTAPEDLNNEAGKTLWQNITANPNLSDFAEIIKKVEFDSYLNSPRFYTVFAPENGSFKADSVLALDNDLILKEFVKQHIVEYNHPINSAIEDKTKLLSLNAKSHNFSATAYGDAGYTDKVNLPSSNGVMHIVNHNEGFYNNVYEYIDKVEGCDLFRDYIKTYDEQYIDISNSILGPILHGEQTYEYIEYAHRNNVINRTMGAQLENEDSSYTVLFPNDEAWQKSYDRISKDYVFIPKISFMDFSLASFPSTAGASIAATAGKTDVNISAPEYLTDSITKYNMVRNLAFSHGYDCNEKLLTGGGTKTDTLFSKSRKNLVSALDVEEHTVATHKMSNGFVRIVDSIPFQPWQTFEPVVASRRVGRAFKADYRRLVGSKLYYQTERDTLFKNVPDFIYERIMGDKSPTEDIFEFISTSDVSNSAQPELDFILGSDILSTKYHIYVVTVPEQIMDDGVERVTPLKPYYLNFYLNYTTAENEQKKVELKLSPDADPAWGATSVTEKSGSKNVTSIVTEPGYINVIDLGEFEFPVSYYGTEAYPSLMMCHTQTFTSASKRAKYEQQMRVAGIFLFPVEADTYFKNKE